MTPDKELIGTTSTTPNGYRVEVYNVEIPNAGYRIRLELHRKGQFIRHLDITTLLALQLWPLLRKAADIGKPKGKV